MSADGFAQLTSKKRARARRLIRTDPMITDKAINKHIGETFGCQGVDKEALRLIRRSILTPEQFAAYRAQQRRAAAKTAKVVREARARLAAEDDTRREAARLSARRRLAVRVSVESMLRAIERSGISPVIKLAIRDRIAASAVGGVAPLLGCVPLEHGAQPIELAS